MAAVPPLIGRYQIKSLIGRGGMGSLYLAHDPNTSRLVTIKVLTATLDSPELRERFARETRALAALSHPNVVDIYDSGDFEGSPFIVMEYVRGETLDELIQRRAPLSVSQKLKLMAELCAGLAHAHEAGIIHRDIKPANLMVDQQGHLKILDFGIAYVAESGNKTRMGLPLTQINMTIGTPGYMSPEQIDGGTVDHRSDIFAVGAVCYELLSYNVAFAGASTQAIERNVLQGRPVSLARQNPDLDPEIDEIVQRALKKDPIKRFQDAATFERALEKVRARLGSEVQAPPVRRPAPPAPTRREVNQARAEAAYQRAAAALAEGGRDAARRFAAEALAEDPSHVQARSLLAGLEPPRSPIAPTTQADDDLPPTIIGMSFGNRAPEPEAAPTIIVPPSMQGPKRPHLPAPRQAAPKARTPDSDPPRAEPPQLPPWRTWTSPGSPLASLWKRYSIPIMATGALGLAAGVVAAAVWFFTAGPSGVLLTIAKPANGTISASGINCGTDGDECTTRRPEGEIVELILKPDAGFAFARYIGDCAPAGRTLMTAPRNCSVEFGPVETAPVEVTQTLTISPVPIGGSLEGVDIICGTKGSVCSANLPQGVPAELHPTADSGYTFMGFTGDCVPLGHTQMTGSRTCGATFQLTAQLATAPPPQQKPVPVKPTPVPVGVTATTSTPGSTPQGGRGVPQAPATPVDKPIPVPTTEGVGAPTAGNIDKPPQGPVEKPVTDEQFAKGKIVELLKAWCAAYEAIDPGAVQVLFPTVNMKQLEIQLNKSKYNSVQCSIGEPTYMALDAIKGTAKVRVETKRVFVHTFRAQKPETQELIATLQLRRADSRSPWLIAQAEYIPKPK
jgi:serine/threonine protein kinase